MPAEVTDKLVAAVLIAAPLAPMLPVPEVKLTVVAVKVPVVSVMALAALRIILPMLLPEPILPLMAMLPLVVARLKVSPEPTVILEPVKVTLPLLLMYALPAEVTDKLVAAVLIAAPLATNAACTRT